MSKSKFAIDKLVKLFEQGLVSYKDLSSEILNILRSLTDKKKNENIDKKTRKIVHILMSVLLMIIIIIILQNRVP